MNIFSVFYLIYALLVHTYGEEITTDEGVLVLTKSNFQQAITDNEYILVEFYAPWCGHCKRLAPEFVKAAKLLADSQSAIKLGKVDATQETQLAEENSIKGYPTLKFYRNGIPIEYNGERTANELVAWMNKKSGPQTVELKTIAEVEKFVEDNNVAIVGFFDDQTSDEAKAFLTAASVIDEYAFGTSSNDDVYSKYEVKSGSIILFKKFDEKKNVFEGEVTAENIKKFIATYSLPLIVEFNHESAQKIFGGDIVSHLILFVSKSDAKTKEIVDAAASIADPFRKQVLFVTIDSDEEDHQRILEFFGMKKEEVPAARLIKLEKDMAKYKPESNELSAAVLQKFVQDFLDGNLKQHLLAQDLPEDWDKEPVRVLVATNFDSVVLDPKKDVLVEFYAPWCTHCKQLAPIYDKVGEHFANEKDILIAKMDATANELEHTKIVNYPTIKLYTKGENKVIEYKGPRNFEGLTRFVESGGVDSGDAEEPVREETEEDDSLKDEL